MRQAVLAALAFAISLPAGAGAAPPSKTSGAQVRDSDLRGRLPKKVDIDVRDADVRNVLELFAEAGKVNLVLADEVRGKVTIKLHDVEWFEAMAIVLQAKGLGFERNGDVLVIDTLQNMTARAEKKVRITDAKMTLEPLKMVLIPVRYARAKDLEPIVRSLLSPRGTVAVDERSNTLIVTDVNAEVVKTRLSLK